jgi:hypothetical protein
LVIHLTIASLGLAAAGRAQTASLSGRITDAATGQPLPGATVTHLGSGRVSRADSTGRYRVEPLESGLQRFLVVATGFPRSSLTLAFTTGERMERDLALDSATAGPAPVAPAEAQRVAPVTVAASPVRADPRFRDFERRRTTGRGQYIVREDIEQAGYYSLQDAVRNMRGVNVACGGGGGCYITMARAQRGCTPEYIVDERVDNMFGPQVPIRDIEGIEVYTGPSDVAGEFAGVNAGCGVVVIWTRNGPPRRPKK